MKVMPDTSTHIHVPAGSLDIERTEGTCRHCGNRIVLSASDTWTTDIPTALFTMDRVERVSTLVTNFEDAKQGDVFYDGSETKDGVANYFVVTRINRGPSRGFYAVFVDPDDLTQRRLPDDREFFVWDFDFERGGRQRITFA